MLGDIVVRHIEAVGDDNGLDQPAVVFGKTLVCHEYYGQLQPLGSTKNYFLDYPRAGIGVDPDFQIACSCVRLPYVISVNAGYQLSAIYGGKKGSPP
jgi:hypothetical protein